MKNRLTQLINTYFGPDLDLRVRLFNALAVISGVFCLVLAAVNIFAYHGFTTVLVDVVSALFCFALVVFAKRSGNYHLCHAITIIGVFFILFPFLFFRMGGYHGGMPLFLVFAIVYTVFMLEKYAFLVSAIELAVYAGLYLYIYQNPGAFTILTSEKNYLISNIVNLVVVSAALGATMYAQARLYRKQQQMLDEQNDVLVRASQAKTEFLSNTSHEMRTPLTVISVNVQTVTEMLEDMGGALADAEASALLQSAQQEIMRLARMVGGMLTLASMSENTDKRAVDFTSLLRGSAEMLSLHLQKRGNRLTSEVAEELHVFGNADLLAQVMANLLQNSSAYTRQGEITLRAEKSGPEVQVTVKDTGDGISAELLPHVFERGVSTGGTGFGLYLCKTVVESHGGRIWIESEPGSGTTVTLALPTYEGQFGGVEE